MSIPETARIPDITCNSMQLFLTDGQIIDANEGFLLPISLCMPFSINNGAVRQFRYQLRTSQSSQSKIPDVILGKFVIYAPSLIGIWAPAILASIPNTVGLILDKAWAGSQIQALWLAGRLRYERMRLGSDVESPYLRKQIPRENLQKALPHLTIGQWIDAIDKIRQKSVFMDTDFIFWRDNRHTVDIRSWIASRLCSRTE
ncbi:MAG: hypothetical protein JSC189_000412 [Candidatus Tokpelaia sp. JSC189]|nr:MAG: hypothetical protein JSC189_000412 [Candidatus Tokpelaia sp. JSC189]